MTVAFWSSRFACLHELGSARGLDPCKGSKEAAAKCTGLMLGARPQMYYGVCAAPRRHKPLQVGILQELYTTCCDNCISLAAGPAGEAIVGTCENMCPDEERQEREGTGQLHPFERVERENTKVRAVSGILGWANPPAHFRVTQQLLSRCVVVRRF